MNYFNYFTEIEEHFRAARGTGLFTVSPLDWALIEAWKNGGIPLEAVLRGIDVAFEKWRKRPARARIHMVNSLAYCTQAVMAEAQSMANAGVAPVEKKEVAAPFPIDDVREFLIRNAAALRKAGQEETAASLEVLDLDALYADLEQLEQRLTAIEEKMIARLRASASEEQLFEARRALDRELKPYRSKMTADQLGMLEKKFLERKFVRVGWGAEVEFVLFVTWWRPLFWRRSELRLRAKARATCRSDTLHRMKRAALVFCIFLTACAKKGPADWDKTETMIPMRDGIRLHTLIYAPKNQTGKLPLLMERSPYGWTDGRPERSLANRYKQLADEGFIFVFQDIRGRYDSEGEFMMERAPRDKSKPNSIDEATDAYDTVDWLIKNVPSHNGRAGILGISYGGWLTAMALMEPHPALKAASEQASPADMFLGDDFHHNGAFRLSYGFEYVSRMETGKTQFKFDFDKNDTYDWYLTQGPLSELDKKYFHGEKPTWNNFVNHPNYDSFWKDQVVNLILKKTTVPNLNVAGWWDQEDYYGPMKIYEELEKQDAQDRKNYLVVGPWRHGGWGAVGTKLGPIEFGADQSLYFREKIEAPWFAYWLKDKGQLHQPEAIAFETGRNSWESYSAWPPREGIQDRKLNFAANNKLSFEPQRDAETAFDSYVSDPAHPVPYRHQPIQPTYGPGSQWGEWLVQDQRFVYQRPDVLGMATEPLSTDLVIAGDVVAHIFASTTGSDADFIVKLIDAYPENDPKLPGYQLMIANDVFRARFRNSFEKPERVEPNKVYEYAIDIHSANHVFRPGHRVMVQVQSTWFPLIDRNPQTFVDNIYKASAADYQAATQKIYHKSYIQLPVQFR